MMKTKRSNDRCQGKTKAGKPCPAAATSGGLCFFHANPRLASKLGRKGGSRKKQNIPADPVAPLPPLDSVKAVREANYRLIQEVYAGELDPQRAKGLAPLLALQVRLIDTEGLEKRLESLEAWEAETRKSDLERQGRGFRN